jgi:hypothetical protein
MTHIARPSRSQKVSTTSIVLTVTAILLAIFVYAASSSTSSQIKMEAVEIGTKTTTNASEILTWTVKNIPYYHCSGSQQHLVLLHGAKFTKEDWKTSGILDKLCHYPGLSVVALDLPVSAGHQELIELLSTMQNEKLLSVPVALVTPSASGKTITDWIMTGNVSHLPNYISKWIPVAAGSVSSATDEQVSSLSKTLPIFAIYGNRDRMGKKTTERLQSLAGAKTLELEGGHPCYLDSPAAFVAAVLEDLGNSN